MKETFDLKNLTAGENYATVQGFTVGDVIELAAGLSLEEVSKKNAATAIYKVTGAEGTKEYGTLTITGVKAGNLAYDAGTGKLTRNK